MKPSYIFPVVLFLAACSEPPTPVKQSGGPVLVTPAATSPHGLDAKLVARGGEIYKANCAACHGANAEGAPNWSKKGGDGKLPPPPLDASGHGWHHPKSALVQTIKEGTLKLGGGMPAWKGTLTDDDIEAVVSWIQSRWPEEVYAEWLGIDRQARAGRKTP